MYVRKKFMRRGDKTYGPYWQVVRSRRIDGKPRQEVVANVGRFESREAADRLARAMGLLCGALGCGEAATCELTWRGFARNTPVEWDYGGQTYGALVCPDHLEEWHRRQLDYRADRPWVIPLVFPPESTQQEAGKSLL
jgi:hypothetical protein